MAKAAPPSLAGKAQQLELMLALPDFSDVSLRDYQETMQRPFFSLSKNKRIKPIEYVSPDGKVTVHVSPNPLYGMATIWDLDILIFLQSVINEKRERQANDLGPTIQISPSHLLQRIGRDVSGRAYERLLQALDRLQSTTIKTNIRADNRREHVFSWIESYSHIVDERSNRSLGMEITLSRWLYEGIIENKALLSITPRYFEITSGLGRWLYRVARKHAGGNGADGFTITFKTLHAKSGSEQAFRFFKSDLLALVRENGLPDIHLEAINLETNPQLRMVMRKYLEGNQAAGSDTAPSPKAFGAKSVSAGSSSAKPRKTAPSAHTGTVTAGIPSKRVDIRFADEVMDPEDYATMRRDCPGWDYDTLMADYRAYIQANPDEIPPNFSKRFLGFVMRHHARNRDQVS